MYIIRRTPKRVTSAISAENNDIILFSDKAGDVYTQNIKNLEEDPVEVLGISATIFDIVCNPI